MESLPPENRSTGRSHCAATSRMRWTASASSCFRWEVRPRRIRVSVGFVEGRVIRVWAEALGEARRSRNLHAGVGPSKSVGSIHLYLIVCRFSVDISMPLIFRGLATGSGRETRSLLQRLAEEALPVQRRVARGHDRRVAQALLVVAQRPPVERGDAPARGLD